VLFTNLEACTHKACVLQIIPNSIYRPYVERIICRGMCVQKSVDGRNFYCFLFQAMERYAAGSAVRQYHPCPARLHP